ncbi:MAG: RNB domain-containing ribonuclease, partial [Candidatus Thorarchaeota archaeon]
KILTIRGIHEIKASQMTKRKLNLSVTFPKQFHNKDLDREILPRLKDSIKRFGSSSNSTNKLSKESQRTDIGQKIVPPTEHDLWLKVTKYLKEKEQPFSISLSIQEIAKIWFKSESISLEQYTIIDELLKLSSSPGVGYFNVKDNPKWTVLDPSDYSNILVEIKNLDRLREKLVETEDYEDEEGYIQTRHIPVGIKYAGLTSDDQELFKKVQTWMADLVKFSRLGQGVGLAGTLTHQIDKFSLAQYLRFLAEDWTETRNILQSASAMTEFLFRTDFWTESEALVTISKRIIEQEPTFTWEVDPEIEELAVSFPEPANDSEATKDRKDLRHLLAYTVDPKGARDFDQALSYERLSDGYVFWVHIADVSHYVNRGSKLDEYAKQRATAVYLPSRGLPMNPPALSTGLCALQANVDRLCMTVRLEFDDEGLRRKVDFYEAIIHVKDNLTYEYVDKKINENDPYWLGMLELGNKLRKLFRGLNVESSETKMSTKNPLLEVNLSETSISSEMNEMFMIAANEAVGEKLRESNLPSIYRCHPLPDKPDVEKFNDQMKALGLEVEVTIPKIINNSDKVTEEDSSKKTAADEENILEMLKAGGKLSLTGGGFMTTKSKKEKSIQEHHSNQNNQKEVDQENNVTSTNKAISRSVKLQGLATLSSTDQELWMKPFREVLEKVQQVENPITRKVMHLTVLGMFGRAYYTKDNIGHFGLGSTCYSHFTAPIRRYSDIIAHRLLKGILRKTATPEDPVYTSDELEELTELCSTQSQKAESIEFQINGVGLVLMTRREEWRGTLSGVVTKVLPRGIFLLIKEMVEGRINMRELTKDEIIVDPSESIAFRKRREDAQIKQILKASDWQEMLDEENEPIEVLVRLGQFLQVKIIGRDYVEGKLELIPII